MQKPEVDYSNTIIYKITCKDPNIKDVYVGHTVNFVQRKHGHKQSCNNEKSSNYKCKLYETIRSNGGWDNWHMEIIHFCKCKDQYEARSKEQEYFVLLNANLNSIEPLPKPKEVVSTKIVKKSTAIETTVNIEPNNKKKYLCEQQDNLKCNKCRKTYTDRNSLRYHEKICRYTSSPSMQHINTSKNDRLNLYDSIQLLMKNNQQLRNDIITKINKIVVQNTALVEENMAVINQYNAQIEQCKVITESVKNQKPNMNTSENTTNS